MYVRTTGVEEVERRGLEQSEMKRIKLKFLVLSEYESSVTEAS